MVVLVELCRSDLHPTANGEMESLRQWKAAQHESRRQENLLLSVQSPTRPKCGILLEHRPDLSLDSVINGDIEDNGAAQNIRPTGWKISANCALQIP